MLPPIVHTCCGTPCFQEYESEQDENYACWGNIYCINCDFYETEDGSYDEYRYASCEGHEDVWRTPGWDKSKYRKPE